jgi:hypothetical protein
MKRISLWIVPVLLASVCTATIVQAGQLSDADKNTRLLAAAEPFEGLTEQSFTARPKDLDRMIRNVQNAAHRVATVLSTEQDTALTQQLNTLGAAMAKTDRSALALAAIEGYRILVSATYGTKVPTEVSLLDYSGFRYDADLKANPARWSDMQEASAFATKQWNMISARVTDQILKQRVTETLRKMQTAISAKSVAGAREAVKGELDLVDTLEAWFNHPQA